ncbi:glutathione S-transferase 4-like [Hordeum vulgare subsp. vulgare]|uniref:glutathione S-transferase 4-like n=1 Tax=Hordeum vulgare subsp. vulgare TaxID=112509 RepID=UPI000B488327|nr:glutathione S-transferase 4-like [Hordeum vulgare subsp. vulgare]
MAPAVKVYGWAMSPFVARPLLCLEEAGVDYELVPMSREAGDHRQPDFLARNPFGQVPVLEDGDLTIFESRAIARHVLRKYKPELLVGDGSPESAAAVDVWLEVEAHQHHPVLVAITMQCLVAPLLGNATDQDVLDENLGKLRKVLEEYEARLSASKYLAGQSVSLADLSHFPMMRYFMETEFAALVEEHPHVKAWWEELKARPAARRVTEFMPPDFGLGKKAEQG